MLDRYGRIIQCPNCNSFTVAKTTEKLPMLLKYECENCGYKEIEKHFRAVPIKDDWIEIEEKEEGEFNPSRR